MWSAQATHIGDKRNVYKTLVQKLERKRSFGKLHVYMKIILKWDLNEEGVKLLTFEKG
jgi:hypothetical protein